MVQMLVDGLAGKWDEIEGVKAGSPDDKIEVIHIDVRLSDSVDDIGQPGWRKLVRLIRYCARAIVARFRYRVTCFYYVPAPALKAAILRDWIVMALCRPFFPTIIYHWHAIGLGNWIEHEARPVERWVSRALLARPELSIVLGEYNRADAMLMRSREIALLPNGIPDPCPQFDRDMLAMRIARAKDRKVASESFASAKTVTALPVSEFRVMFIGLCHREKGLFDALDAIALLNKKFNRTRLRVKFTVAGGFWNEGERQEFEKRIAAPDLQSNGEPLVKYLGFVSGEQKRNLFRESDCLCFPTYYSAESFGLVVAEAMAWGLHVVTTRWRTVPELLPPAYPGAVPIRSPEEIANKLEEMATADHAPELRRRFVDCYSEASFARGVVNILRRLGSRNG